MEESLGGGLHLGERGRGPDGGVLADGGGYGGDAAVAVVGA